MRGISVAVSVSTSASAELLQPLLLPDAEAMFLVDDHGAEVLELDVPAEQLVRAMTMSMEPSVMPFTATDDSFAERKRAGSGQLHRPILKPVREIVEVLLGEQRRRHRAPRPASVGDGDEGGAQRDFGLYRTRRRRRSAGPSVARLQILDHGLDGRRLIGRLSKGKPAEKAS